MAYEVNYDIAGGWGANNCSLPILLPTNDFAALESWQNVIVRSQTRDSLEKKTFGMVSRFFCLPQGWLNPEFLVRLNTMLHFARDKGSTVSNFMTLFYWEDLGGMFHKIFFLLKFEIGPEILNKDLCEIFKYAFVLVCDRDRESLRPKFRPL